MLASECSSSYDAETVDEKVLARLDAIDAQLTRVLEFVERLSPLIDRAKANPLAKKMLGL